MLLSFRGQLMGVEHKAFVPDQGANKGVEIKSTQLKFNTADGKDCVLKAPGHISVDASKMRVDLDWELEVVPSVYQGKTNLTVTKISGSKGK